jgi:hypothetical protein
MLGVIKKSNERNGKGRSTFPESGHISELDEIL